MKKIFFIFLLVGFTFIGSIVAEELTEQVKVSSLSQESKAGTSPVRNTELKELNKISNGTRIIISTSGLAQFTSYGLDNPPRLVIEFQTRNVLSKIGSELVVNQGAIKRITSDFFGSESEENKTLKSLTFELLEKAPYKIWQEIDTIIIDIQTPQEMALFPDEGREVFRKNEAKEVIIKRLEAMGLSLKQREANQALTEAPELVPELISLPQSKFIVSSETKKGGAPKVIVWLIGLSFISGLGLAWLFWRRYRLMLDKNIAAKEVAKLKAQLQEQNKFLEHEQIIQKTVEETSKKIEKDFEHVKKELQKGKQLLEQEEKVRKTTEEELSKKEKECTEIKGSLESLKEVLVEKGIAKKLTTPEKEGELWIAGKSAEKRKFPRLDLSRDYNRTIILRIESQDKSNPSTSLGISPEQSRRAKSIKSFANNISVEGLCFETRREFKEKESIHLRLFFFGDNVPMIKTKAKVNWSRADLPINYYGISFVSLEEKDKAALNHYIESKIIEKK